MFRKPDPRITALRELPAFSACNGEQLERIAKLTDHVQLPAGAELTHEGKPGRECFVLASGEAVVTIGETEIARLGPGDFVGEMAVLDDQPRCATVEAVTDVEAVVMTPGAFVAILDSCPSVGRRVLRTLADRLRTVETEVWAT